MFLVSGKGQGVFVSAGYIPVNGESLSNHHVTVPVIIRESP